MLLQCSSTDTLPFYKHIAALLLAIWNFLFFPFMILCFLVLHIIFCTLCSCNVNMNAHIEFMKTFSNYMVHYVKHHSLHYYSFEASSYILFAFVSCTCVHIPCYTWFFIFNTLLYHTFVIVLSIRIALHTCHSI